MKAYLIGSLRNPEVPKLGELLRKATKWDIFDDWYSAGPEADDYWRDYERAKGNGLQDALRGHAAKHVFAFDREHLDSSDAAILLWPAGKSCHLEFGYVIGQGKPGWIVIDGEPERFDVMLNFADKVFTNYPDLVSELNSFHTPIKAAVKQFTVREPNKPNSWYFGRGLVPPGAELPPDHPIFHMKD